MEQWLQVCKSFHKQKGQEVTSLIVDNTRVWVQEIRKGRRSCTHINNETSVAEIQREITQIIDLCRQHRASIFLSFCGWLARQSQGRIVKPVIQKHGHNKTFAHRRKRTVASNLSDKQLKMFFESLKGMGPEMYLFAWIQLHGAR